MSSNVIQATFDGFMKGAGFSKRSGSWYRISDEVITVVELQKSQYGLQYYVNLALWLRPLGEVKTPKEQGRAIFGRASRGLLEARRAGSRHCWTSTCRCLKGSGPRICWLFSLPTWGLFWRQLPASTVCATRQGRRWSPRRWSWVQRESY